MIPTEPVVALSARRHARSALAVPQWSTIATIARAISRDVVYTLVILLAFMCACAGGLFGALAIALVAHGDFALALLSTIAAALSVLACRPALHLDARRAAKEHARR